MSSNSRAELSRVLVNPLTDEASTRVNVKDREDPAVRRRNNARCKMQRGRARGYTGNKPSHRVERCRTNEALYLYGWLGLYSVGRTWHSQLKDVIVDYRPDGRESILGTLPRPVVLVPVPVPVVDVLGSIYEYS
jgi:hypothetical protein